MMKVAAIIPAFNEQDTLGAILGVLVAARIDEIVVVNDGSSDATSKIAHTFPVKVIDSSENRGKGEAIMKGVQATTAPLLLFLDADLVGLTVSHVQALLKPVLTQEASMSLGIIDRGTYMTRAIVWMRRKKVPWPMLTGQRALLRAWYAAIPALQLVQYGVEVALNEYCRTHNLAVSLVPSKGLHHVVKEKKMGLVRGFWARIKMCCNVATSFVKIRRAKTPNYKSQ